MRIMTTTVLVLLGAVLMPDYTIKYSPFDKRVEIYKEPTLGQPLPRLFEPGTENNPWIIERDTGTKNELKIRLKWQLIPEEYNNRK